MSPAQGGDKHAWALASIPCMFVVPTSPAQRPSTLCCGERGNVRERSANVSRAGRRQALEGLWFHPLALPVPTSPAQGGDKHLDSTSLIPPTLACANVSRTGRRQAHTQGIFPHPIATLCQRLPRKAATSTRKTAGPRTGSRQVPTSPCAGRRQALTLLTPPSQAAFPVPTSPAQGGDKHSISIAITVHRLTSCQRLPRRAATSTCRSSFPAPPPRPCQRLPRRAATSTSPSQTVRNTAGIGCQRLPRRAATSTCVRWRNLAFYARVPTSPEQGTTSTPTRSSSSEP